MGKFDFTSFGASLGEDILSTGVNWLLNQSNNTKQFNQAKELQQIAFQNQKDMFHMQNARQDQLNANQALTQRQSLQRAGINLNADVGFSPNVGVQTASAPNGSLPPLQPTLADFTGLYKAQQESQLIDAQRKNIENDTKLKQEEARTKEIYNMYADQLLLGQINLNGSTIELQQSNVQKNTKEMDTMVQQIQESEQRIKESQAKIENFRHENKAKDAQALLAIVQARWHGPHTQASIKALNAKAELDKQTALVSNELMPYLIVGHHLDNSVKESVSKLNAQQLANLRLVATSLGINVDQSLVNLEHSRFNLESDKTYKNAERGTQIAKTTASTIHELCGAAADVIKATIPTP